MTQTPLLPPLSPSASIDQGAQRAHLPETQQRRGERKRGGRREERTRRGHGKGVGIWGETGDRR